TGAVTVTDDGNGNYTVNSTDPDESVTNEVNTAFAVVGGNLTITDSDGTLNVPLTDLDSEVTQVVTTGNTIAAHDSASGTSTDILETVTTISQATTTGIITYSNEAGANQTANVISSDTNNNISAGTDGGAYYNSFVKAMGKVNANGTTNKAPLNATVTKLGTGQYQINLTPAMADANYIIQLTVLDSNGAGNDDYDISYSTQLPGSFIVEIGDNDNGGSNRANRDFEFMFTVFNY
ncbi:hypothetical protein, partial [Winogradskyella alexanderae]